jgi:hypothetical protein
MLFGDFMVSNDEIQKILEVRRKGLGIFEEEMPQQFIASIM